MTNYYVDAAAAGTGDGLTPTNAFVSILSVPWNVTSCDRAWVRRTQNETLAASAWLGPVAGDTVNLGLANNVFIIGWPIATYPMFDQRPAAGVSAGWDSDAPNVGVYSLFQGNVPTFSNSNANVSQGILFSTHCVYLNINFNQLASNNDSPLHNGVMSLFPGMADNIFITRAQGQIVNNLQTILPNPLGKYTYTGTGAAKDLDIFCQHLVIHSSVICSGGLIGNNAVSGDFEIGVLENLSNSVDAFFYGTSARYLRKMRVHKAIGVKPYSGAVLGVNTSWNGFVIDDYYGEGPVIQGNPRRPTVTLATSAQAMHTSSGRVLKYSVLSTAITKYGLIPRLQAILTKAFAVVSGTPITIKLPIYVDSTAIFSPAAGGVRAQLMTAGGETLWSSSANVSPGSYSNWGGTLIANGSAYLMTCLWTPRETGFARYDVYMPSISQANSGDPLSVYALFGEPY